MTELSLRCGVNRVGGGGAIITRDLLYKLTKLRLLNINFYENYVGDEGVIEITKGITKLEHLEVLNVNFGFNDVKGYGFIKTLELFVKSAYQDFTLCFSSN